MSVDRLTRVNALIRREIGEALFKVLGREPNVDASSITITQVITSRNLREARVRVSIRDQHERRAALLSMLRRHRAELQEAINRDLTLKYTPRLSFELDTSLERGDHVLDVLAHLDPPADDPATPDDGEPAS